MEGILFYIFSAFSVIGAIALVAFKNPVSSAMSMVASFLGLAALFIGLNAYFVGIIQILVYAGAIMVLFLFIIMLLDLKAEAKWSYKPVILVGGILIPLLFIVQLCGILSQVPNVEPEPLDLEKAAKSFYDEERKEDEQSEIHKSLADGSLPDVNLIGLTMFGHQGDNETIATPGYNFPLQVVGVLLLVATVGVVALSMKKKPTREEPAERSEP
ncbi:MAG: NADH-quinone oxidoreductase subunit J [Roseibacillus sp.]|jgi:NADH-quinone oxidoreductase subunit J